MAYTSGKRLKDNTLEKEIQVFDEVIDKTNNEFVDLSNIHLNFEKINQFIKGVYEVTHSMQHVMSQKTMDALYFSRDFLNLIIEEATKISTGLTTQTKSKLKKLYTDYLKDATLSERLSSNDKTSMINEVPKFNFYHVKQVQMNFYNVSMNVYENMHKLDEIFFEISTLINNVPHLNDGGEKGVKNLILSMSLYEQIFSTIEAVKRVNKSIIIADIINPQESDYWYSLFKSSKKLVSIDLGISFESESLLMFKEDYKDMSLFLINFDKLMEEEGMDPQKVDKKKFLEVYGTEMQDLNFFLKQFKKKHIIYGDILSNHEILEKMMMMGFRSFAVKAGQEQTFIKTLNNYLSRRGKYRGIYAEKQLKKAIKGDNYK